MILLSNHLLTLQEFEKVEGVVIRINMAHVKDISELKKFLKIDYDIFLDYPKGRTKPPIPTLNINDALKVMNQYKNIKYFALSNIEDVSEVNMICDIIPSLSNVIINSIFRFHLKLFCDEYNKIFLFKILIKAGWRRG